LPLGFFYVIIIVEFLVNAHFEKLIGILLLIIGWGFASWAAIAGLSFCTVMLIGFIGTAGREAGKDFVEILMYTIIAVSTGYLVGKFGQQIYQQAKQKRKRKRKRKT